MTNWEPNAVLIPRHLFEQFSTGTLDDVQFCNQLRALLGSYPSPPVPDVSLSPPAPVRQCEGTETVDWLRSELIRRYPTSRQPDLRMLNEIVAMVGGEQQILEDTLLVIREGGRKFIASIGPFIRSVLHNHSGDFRALSQQADAIRAGKRRDSASFIDEVMQQAEQRLPTIPAKTGPNTRNVNRMRALEQKEGGSVITP